MFNYFKKAFLISLFLKTLSVYGMDFRPKTDQDDAQNANIQQPHFPQQQSPYISYIKTMHNQTNNNSQRLLELSVLHKLIKDKTGTPPH